jgi:hypothetical protein
MKAHSSVTDGGAPVWSLPLPSDSSAWSDRVLPPSGHFQIGFSALLRHDPRLWVRYSVLSG